jgi:hypothetical protein
MHNIDQSLNRLIHKIPSEQPGRIEASHMGCPQGLAFRRTGMARSATSTVSCEKHTFVGDRPSNITNAKKIARTTGGFLTTSFDGAIGGCVHPIGARRRVRRGEPRSCATSSMEGIEWGKNRGDAGRGVMGRALRQPRWSGGRPWTRSR